MALCRQGERTGRFRATDKTCSVAEMEAQSSRDACAAYGSTKYHLGVFALMGLEPLT